MPIPSITSSILNTADQHTGEQAKPAILKPIHSVQDLTGLLKIEQYFRGRQTSERKSKRITAAGAENMRTKLYMSSVSASHDQTPQ